MGNRRRTRLLRLVRKRLQRRDAREEALHRSGFAPEDVHLLRAFGEREAVSGRMEAGTVAAVCGEAGSTNEVSSLLTLMGSERAKVPKKNSPRCPQDFQEQAARGCLDLSVGM